MARVCTASSVMDPQPNATSQRAPLLGLLAILSVVAIYTINFVATRYSVGHGLTPFDLTALRYAVSGLVLLPYFYRLGPGDLGGVGWPKGITLSCLAGSPYMVTFYYGVSLAPAAHGAVLNPGIVPSVVFLALVLLGRQRFSTARAASLAAIVVGVALVAGPSFSGERDVLLGDALLVTTGISWGLFTVLVRIWEVKPLQAAAIVSVVSLVYLPFYLAFPYRGFESVSIGHLAAQAAFQGLINAIASVYLVTYAVRTLGAQLAALFSPLVPVLTTLLAIPLLGESPAPIQWAGVSIVVVGMLSAAAADYER